ncbi:hypothetical protein [Adlercreutzia faecimuris]|uniref:Uncharacterized protein n=1 Tax=Adlercreutzia faecimuris TaxID=2897341 RepID=A0ABS9WJB3_9ACTN|nr:hypothetical protein [Adlercreutzia sp. JBNU-10]MCI2242967.1 hypothetical protein [Adlercreutzia sp. JBNU-10]
MMSRDFAFPLTDPLVPISPFCPCDDLIDQAILAGILVDLLDDEASLVLIAEVMASLEDASETG